MPWWDRSAPQSVKVGGEREREREGESTEQDYYSKEAALTLECCVDPLASRTGKGWGNHALELAPTKGMIIINQRILFALVIRACA